MTILSVLATTFGSLMALAAIPQIYKIYNRKSAKDISAISFSFFALGGIIWFFYGFELKSFPVILTNSLCFITNSTILVGWFLYGRNGKKSSK
ncbi:MAG: SemiSWEET family transporter [Candidatus Woesearchaeota archaeon]|jgi:MtN3 and saliva related transmembrane protein